MRRTLVVAILLFCLPVTVFGGGPLLVDSNGVAQTWANGQITYYTDQGDLSSLLPSAQADQFVADAWSRWTSVPLAALTITHGGHLDEDITGTNFAVVRDIRADSAKPLAIVYDADGKVIDAVLGDGAGARELCSTNSVLGQVDRFSDDGNIAHALIVINGKCATSASDLPRLRFRLVREFGRILGLDYSQLNENVVTGVPGPTGQDYAGYPVMHPLGLLCTELSCMPNADVPRMDDRAALARLYPSSSFTATTGRVHGVIRFPAWKGVAGQPMQGMNVVARQVEPATGRVSRQFAASSVSGFLFRGNAGNPMTGYTNALGERWDTHGSADAALEGYYDLAGLEIPEGYNSVVYELSVEPLNTMYNGSNTVGPYVAGQVTTPGTAAPLRVTVARGAEVAQDFTMQGAASEPTDRWEPSSFIVPRPVPQGGSWTASLNGYGDWDYYSFSAHANRTFTFDVTALDERGVPSTNKALPVLGVWSGSDAEDSPEVAETYFNTSATATTRLEVVVGEEGQRKVGVADYRGDGRPDFRYTAHLFYADTISPPRVGVQGGSLVTIQGLGFTAATQVSLGGVPIASNLVAADQIVFWTPRLADGVYDLVVNDPLSGASSQMKKALIAGGAGAKLVLINGANPQVPVGTVAPNAITVQVVDATDGTSGPGATVLFSAASAVRLVGCPASPCPVISDQNGRASVQVEVLQVGASTITATLPTGGSVYGTVNGVMAATEITLAQPDEYAVSGTTVIVPISAMVVGNGVPLAGATVNFLKNYGIATVAPGSSNTSASGVANSQVTVSNLAGDVNISACVAPANAPCRTLMIRPVATNNLHIEKISGDGQAIGVGQDFAPIMLRVTDGTGHPVMGAAVIFDVHVSRVGVVATQVTSGEVVTTHYSDPVVLSSMMTTVTSDAAGLTVLPTIAVPAEPVQVSVRATTGQNGAAELQLKSMWIDLPSMPPSSITNTHIRKRGIASKRRVSAFRQH